MTGPDTIVDQFGTIVTHEYVTAYGLDNNGQVDPGSITTAADEIPVIISQPSEEDQQRLEGRLSTGGRRLTVKSDRDIRGDRGGRRDRILIDGEWYEVVEVRDDEHPITGTAKQTVLVDTLGGRS